MADKAMNIKQLSVLLLAAALISCNHSTGKNSVPGRPAGNDMADLNRYMVQKDRERIQNYIERKNLRMTETQTGLWYQILKDGDGVCFKEKEHVIVDYECSLLDGTRCYSSRETGPREYVLGRSEMESGLNEGLRLLKPGAEAIFIIPPFLAYGLIGDRKSIPPRAVLVYTVTVKKQ
jgi:FKBP-type peptidyl-prolyl cis-trans isomerase FkpA